jgi:hypothetical protein
MGLLQNITKYYEILPARAMAFFAKLGQRLKNRLITKLICRWGVGVIPADRYMPAVTLGAVPPVGFAVWQRQLFTAMDNDRFFSDGTVPCRLSILNAVDFFRHFYSAFNNFTGSW